MKTSIALAALVVATLGVTTIAPALAQNGMMGQGNTEWSGFGGRQMQRMMLRDETGMGLGGHFLGLVCSDHGAEALEVAFVHLSHRLTLTADQAKLFDALKTKALTTQTSFADSCKAALPTKDADLLARLKAQAAIEEAHLAALNAVMPDLEAFINSLTADQKASLVAGFADHDGMGRGMMTDRDGNGRMLRAPAPGR